MFLGMEWYWWLFDCCGAGDLHPVQGKVYEMVEQTGTGEEKRTRPENGVMKMIEVKNLTFPTERISRRYMA